MSVSSPSGFQGWGCALGGIAITAAILTAGPVANLIATASASALFDKGAFFARFGAAAAGFLVYRLCACA